MTGYRSAKFRHKCDAKGCYYDLLPSWDDLIDCFPRRIRPTDIDGMVEINDRFLFMEQKGFGAGPDNGQRIALLKLARRKGITVLFFRPAAVGQDDKLEVLLFDGTEPDGWRPQTRDWLKDWLRNWSARAERPGFADDAYDTFTGPEFET